MSHIPFSTEEKVYMKDHDPRKNTHNPPSYGQIADELNIQFKEHNQGKRTRRSVIQFYLESPRDEVTRVIRIPRKVSEGMSGQDLSSIIIYHMTKQTIP